MVERSAVEGARCSPSRQPLPPPDGLIAVRRVKLDQPRLSLRSFASNKGGAAAAKAVEHEIATTRAVADGVGYQRHRLDSGMHGKIRKPIGREGVCPGICPHVGAVAAVLSEFDVINVLATTVLPNEDQFMLATIERAHAPISFMPHYKIF